MPSTRDRCTEPGEYVSTCRDRSRQTMTVGMHFPRCPACGQRVDWELSPESPAWLQGIRDGADAQIAKSEERVVATDRALGQSFSMTIGRRVR